MLKFFIVHNYVYILGACGPGAHNKRNKRNENNYTKEILKDQQEYPRTQGQREREVHSEK